jgi:transposase
MPTKACPNEALMSWAEEWAKEAREVDWQKLLSLWECQVLPRRWVVERSFDWRSHNRRISNDYERLCTSGEAFVYTAMIRLTVRRLACS